MESSEKIGNDTSKTFEQVARLVFIPVKREVVDG